MLYLSLQVECWLILPGQTSMITMVNAGLEGFVKAAALDLTEGRRIVIVHPPWVAETAAALGMDAAPWPNAAKTCRGVPGSNRREQERSTGICKGI